MSQHNRTQKLKEIHKKLKEWNEKNGDDELDLLLEELEAVFAPTKDDGEGEGSNPPGGPGTPP